MDHHIACDDWLLISLSRVCIFSGGIAVGELQDLNTERMDSLVVSIPTPLLLLPTMKQASGETMKTSVLTPALG